jgi:Chaperone of endosialidase/Lower baseplate protein N-terminal domain
MGDDITIGVTEIVNNIEVTAQPNDQIVDLSVIDNTDVVTLNITPTVIEINVNKGSSYAKWGDILGTLSDQTDLQSALDLKANLVDGKVPASELPSYVDDIIEVANYAALPTTGETGKIYVTLNNNKIYRWSGSIYIEIAANNAVWGSITGTLGSQMDLQSALNAKVPYTGANADLNLGSYDLKTSKVWLYDNPNSAFGSLELTDGVLHFEDVDGHSMVTFEDGYLTIANASTIRALLDVSNLTANRDFAFPNSSGTLALTSQLHNAVTLGTANGLSLSTQVLSLGLASSSTNGSLSSTDWNTFNSKQSALGYTAANDANVVHKTGDETIAGVKTFSSSLVLNSSLNITSGAYNIIYNPSNSTYWQTYVDSSSVFNFGFNGTNVKASLTNLGNFTANSFIKSGGTSLQFLKADGSVDSSTYLTSLSGAVLTTTDQNVAGIKNFTESIKIQDDIYLYKESSYTIKSGYTTVTADALDSLVIAPSSTKQGILSFTNLTAPKRFYFPNTEGTIALTSDLHNAVTIGTANGLSLSTQALSLALASTSTTGALSSTDWNTFNGKQNALTNPITGTGTTNYLSKFTGSTALGNSLIYDNGTNVGIGTASPSGKLHISNSANSTFLYSDGAGTGYSFADIRNTGARLVYGIENSTGSTSFTGALPYSSYIGSFATGTAFGIVSGGSLSTTFLSNGNVGIGTTSPSEKLSVIGGNIQLGAGYKLQYSSTAYMTPENNVSGAEIATGGILTIKTGGTTERVRVDASGNVGIGTTSPTDGKLQVAGSSQLGNTIAQTYFGVGAAATKVTSNGAYTIGVDAADGSTERMRITSLGTVGINTTYSNAVYKLVAKTGTDSNIAFGIQGGEASIESFNDAVNAGRPLRFYGDNLQYYTSGSERMRITSGGNVGIGTTSPVVKLEVNSDNVAARFISTTNQVPVSLYNNANSVCTIGFKGSTTTNDYVVRLGANGNDLVSYTNDTERMRITSGGSVIVNNLGTGLVYSNAGALTSTNPSDSRLKDDITDLQYGLNEILKLRPVTYNWKDDKINQGKQFGFIAQEVQVVMPELVKEFETEDGERLGLDKEGIYAALVNAIKELKAEIEILKIK